LFFLTLALVLVILLGFLALGVGLIIAIPVAIFAVARVYDLLSSEEAMFSKDDDRAGAFEPNSKEKEESEEPDLAEAEADVKKIDEKDLQDAPDNEDTKGDDR
jgi:hypothetical protein